MINLIVLNPFGGFCPARSEDSHPEVGSTTLRDEGHARFFLGRGDQPNVIPRLTKSPACAGVLGCHFSRVYIYMGILV